MSLDKIDFGGKDREEAEVTPRLQINEIVRVPEQEKEININYVEGSLEIVNRELDQDAEHRRQINEIKRRTSLQ